jgi:hypothetical protein
MSRRAVLQAGAGTAIAATALAPVVAGTPARCSAGLTELLVEFEATRRRDAKDTKR